tara:strand:+ start:3077 stop:3232 length:156 start_codon:yes stop_codon:yes gene_type:complete
VYLHFNSLKIGFTVKEADATVTMFFVEMKLNSLKKAYRTWAEVLCCKLLKY